MAHRKLAIIRRRLFSGLSVLSLLLCVATLALWWRSYHCGDGIQYARASGRAVWWCAWFNARGSMALGHRFWANAMPQTDFGWTYESYAYTLDLSDAGGDLFLGFGRLMAWSYQMVLIPHWFLALLFAILPALRLRAAIRSHRRHRAGLCPVCGYDLRATPERCPECGNSATENTEENITHR